ncbi:MAG: TetR/AcrR family transcriptional regulator C-terminal domain-containing protein [Caldilineaceae bacterium]|nr:TetR/AcrR family transcriptional regulator C-terminal domain-containing protein [Caldilineaceae bacterium]
MSQKSTDPRIERTLQQIRGAFLALLETQSFDRITVSAVSVRAGINRATFYRHYTDIYDLAQQITDGIDPIALLQQEDEADLFAGVKALFDHAAEYAVFYRAMMQPGGIPGFRARMEEMVAAQLTALLPSFGFVVDQTAMPTSLVVRYVAAAQVSFVQWWLENDMPFSAETAASYLIQLHADGAWRTLGLKHAGDT